MLEGKEEKQRRHALENTGTVKCLITAAEFNKYRRFERNPTLLSSLSKWTPDKEFVFVTVEKTNTELLIAGGMLLPLVLFRFLLFFFYWAF